MHRTCVSQVVIHCLGGMSKSCLINCPQSRIACEQNHWNMTFKVDLCWHFHYISTTLDAFWGVRCESGDWNNPSTVYLLPCHQSFYVMQKTVKPGEVHLDTFIPLSVPNIVSILCLKPNADRCRIFHWLQPECLPPRTKTDIHFMSAAVLNLFCHTVRAHVRDKMYD